MSDLNDDETLDGFGAGGLEPEDMAQEIEALKAEVAALNDKALRVAADAENTKRRAERDANDARAYAIQKFAKDLLDAADNLSRAVQHAPKDSDDPQVKTLITGVEMTEKAIQNAFERNGLKRLDPARGDKFDPNLHQAMMEQADAELPPGSVTMVAQPGYELYGRMIRPAMVAVTPKAPAQAAPKPVADGYAATPAGETGEAVDRKA